MTRLRLAFMGTPDFSVAVLDAILQAGHDVVAVYSQPPRRAGRGMEEQPGPVHRYALDHGLPVKTPLSLKDAAEQQAFAALNLDVAVVVAYGLLLPEPILRAPKYGCLNIHASLLPRWRGAAPIQRAIMAGDSETGVMVMQMEKGLDTGPVLATTKLPIAPRETAGSLHDRLAVAGARLIVETLAQLPRGNLVAQEQSDRGITYAHKIDKAEAHIDWSQGAAHLDAHIRGLTPFPGAYFEIAREGKATRVKVIEAMPVAGKGHPGEVLSLVDGITIACGEQALCLRHLQRAGARAMSADAFLRGFPLTIGEIMS
ncbi:MAG: methionyl-tRNA formyltransferase [Parvibaculum sp.]